jgi:hypothetical protein
MVRTYIAGTPHQLSGDPGSAGTPVPRRGRSRGYLRDRRALRRIHKALRLSANSCVRGSPKAASPDIRISRRRKLPANSRYARNAWRARTDRHIQGTLALSTNPAKDKDPSSRPFRSPSREMASLRVNGAWDGDSVSHPSRVLYASRLATSSAQYTAFRSQSRADVCASRVHRYGRASRA